jgi:hypothetical protein
MVDLRQQPSLGLEEDKPVHPPTFAHPPPLLDHDPSPDIRIRHDRTSLTILGRIKNAVGRIAQQSVDTMRSGVLATVSHVCGVIKSLYIASFRRIEIPFSVLLVTVFLLALFHPTSPHLPTLVLTRICSIPHVPAVLPACADMPPKRNTSDSSSKSSLPDYGSSWLAELIEHGFEPLLKFPTRYSTLSSELQDAVLIIDDLISLAQGSKSSVLSHQSMIVALHRFSDRARVTKALHKFHMHTDRFVDQIIATMDFSADEVGAAPDHSIFLAVMGRKTKYTVASALFNQARNSVTADLKDLLCEGEVARYHLETLEAAIDTLSGVLHADQATVLEALNALMSSWRRMDNEQVRSAIVDTIELENFVLHRDRARTHLASALKTLLDMVEDIKTLQRQVTAPALEGDHGEISVHIEAVRMGAHRLRQRRFEA